MATTTVPNVTLRNGVEMPILGFGVYQIPPDDTERAVSSALEVGYRLIDTAASYGNEEAVGRALRAPDRLIDLIEHNGVPPAVTQIETHPFFQRQADQDLLRANGVQMEAWEGFAEGRNDLFTHPILTSIGETHGKSVAQVVLRWLTQRDVVTIPKSVRRDPMEENLDIFDFSLTDAELGQIEAMDTGASLFFDHRDPTMVSWLNSRRET